MTAAVPEPVRCVPRRGVWRSAGVVALLLLLGLGVGTNPARSDPEVAKFLLEQAEKAISKRQYDEAIQKLERAREEDPDLVEAAYLLGKVHEKKKEPGKALAAYRAFRDGCTRLQAEGRLDKKNARYLKTAEKRLAVLGKGERELEKLQEKFSDALVVFAKRHQKEDVDIAAEAMRRLLAAQPGNARAKDLLRQITGTDDLALPGDEAGDAVPIRGISDWRDLLDSRAIVPGSSTSYKRGILTIDNQNGSIHWTDPPMRAPEVFVYEMDFRVTKEHASTWAVGFAFGKDEAVTRMGGHEFVMGFAQKSNVVLAHASGGQNIDLAEQAVPSVPEGTWRRLLVAVEGRKVRVYLDGKRVASSSVPGRENLGGPIGIFHQRCVAEIRLLRLGTKR